MYKPCFPQSLKRMVLRIHRNNADGIFWHHHLQLHHSSLICNHNVPHKLHNRLCNLAFFPSLLLFLWCWDSLLCLHCKYFSQCMYFPTTQWGILHQSFQVYLQYMFHRSLGTRHWQQLDNKSRNQLIARVKLTLTPKIKLTSQCLKFFPVGVSQNSA